MEHALSAKESGMEKCKQYLLITAIAETVLGFPFLGASIILSLFWIPLLIMLVVHIIALNHCAQNNVDKTGNILGIIANVIGWIPLLGMIMHIITAIFLWKTYSKITKKAETTT